MRSKRRPSKAHKSHKSSSRRRARIVQTASRRAQPKPQAQPKPSKPRRSRRSSKNVNVLSSDDSDDDFNSDEESSEDDQEKLGEVKADQTSRNRMQEDANYPCKLLGARRQRWNRKRGTPGGRNRSIEMYDKRPSKCRTSSLSYVIPDKFSCSLVSWQCKGQIEENGNSRQCKRRVTKGLDMCYSCTNKNYKVKIAEHNLPGLAQPIVGLVTTKHIGKHENHSIPFGGLLLSEKELLALYGEEQSPYAIPVGTWRSIKKDYFKKRTAKQRKDEFNDRVYEGLKDADQMFIDPSCMRWIGAYANHEGEGDCKYRLMRGRCAFKRKMTDNELQQVLQLKCQQAKTQQTCKDTHPMCQFTNGRCSGRAQAKVSFGPCKRLRKTKGAKCEKQSHCKWVTGQGCREKTCPTKAPGYKKECEKLSHCRYKPNSCKPVAGLYHPSDSDKVVSSDLIPGARGTSLEGDYIWDKHVGRGFWICGWVVKKEGTSLNAGDPVTVDYGTDYVYEHFNSGHKTVRTRKRYKTQAKRNARENAKDDK